MTDDTIRLPLLKRLAEQAMTDGAFRAVAREDLARALGEYGYDLNDRERAFVFRFRQALEEANVDLELAKEVDLDALLAADDDHATGLEGLLSSIERTG
ncbi:MAG TPA: hypothetical protein VGR22_08005 [Thermomicrobiales bacterium]|nr:hypothetical protein [Thermomicrobiales bacterium]